MPSAPRGVAVPAGQRCSERSCHTEQEPGKLLQSLALRFTICLTPCDGSQEEMLLGGKGKREIKGAKQAKPSQQHLPPLLSPPPLCPRKSNSSQSKHWLGFFFPKPAIPGSTGPCCCVAPGATSSLGGGCDATKVRTVKASTRRVIPKVFSAFPVPPQRTSLWDREG